MKLKDVFNLNLNTRGGVKLFDKIANKYNLIKSDRKDLVEVVNKGGSSSSDGEYYKLIIPFWDENILQVCASIKGKDADRGNLIIPIALNIKAKLVAYQISTYKMYVRITDSIYITSFKEFMIFSATSQGKTEQEAEEDFNSMFTPITKEEFYDLNNI